MVNKKQCRSLMDIKRFSLCNCLTLFFPETYTAHCMTLDFFLTKVKSGTTIWIDRPDLWPQEYVHVFKIPKKISTFLFSPFNDIVFDQFVFNNARYAISPNEHKMNSFKHLSKKIQIDSFDVFKHKLIRLDKKIASLWGNGIIKILLFYSPLYADKHTTRLVNKYNSIAKKTLNWPFLYIMPTKKHESGRWYHYVNEDREMLFNKIVTLENKYAS